jgi:transcriptional regulator with XRE-family HTH domain
MRTSLNKTDIKKPMKPIKKTNKLNWTSLADQLGVARSTLSQWRKETGAPTVPDLNKWQLFVEANDLARKFSPERAELMAEKLKREIALLDIKVARERRQVISADDVDGILSRIAQGLRAELIQFAEREAVTIAGESGASIGFVRDLLRGLVDRQCDQMQGGIQRWVGTWQDVPKI